MSELYHLDDQFYGICDYIAKKRRFMKDNEWNETISKLKESKTIYIGELSPLTREEQLFEIFSDFGEIKRIIMGLNKYTKNPCGYCFIE